MQVIKRNGNKIDFNPSRILTRIKKQAEGLKVNADEVFIKVTQGLADNMTTNQLDDLISVVAESLAMNHPDYSKLAANIAISKLHKETEDSFIKATKKMYNNGLLSETYYNKVKENIDIIESIIDYSRDYQFDYFGWCSLKDIYLLKLSNGMIVERPQHMYIRVALMITNNEADFKEKYNDLSNQKESPATPIKINIGTKIGQIASCFDENTEVYIHNKGLIPIKDVKVGDKTITHKNNLKNITNVWVNDVNDREVVTFKTYRSRPITCTSNHEFYSISNEQLKWGLKPSFNSIEYLREGDYIKLGYNVGETSVEVIDLFNILKDVDGYELTCDNEYIYGVKKWEQTVHNVKDTVVNHKNLDKIKRFLIIDGDMAKFIGHWYGDGTLLKRNGNIRGISLVAHTKQKGICEFIRNIITNNIGLHFTDYLNKQNKNDSEWYSFSINNNLLGLCFEKLFGSYFDGKKINSFMYDWDKNLVDNFLIGLINSDGCVTNKLDVNLSMKNLDLIKNLSIILKKHGYNTGYSMTKKGLYRLDLGKNLDLIKMVTKHYNDDRLTRDYKLVNSRKYVIKINGETYSQIISKSIISYNKTKVYNLEVEDDHSYNVEGIIAKNCNLSIIPDDSTEGLLNMLGRISVSSSKAEGIGLAISNIRSKESNVGNSDGKAGGILKYLKVVNEALRYWNQRGKRPGSCAVYIEPWHKDIYDVLDIRKKTGDETLRARDLFSALWVPNNFMKAVETNSDWYLFCPHDIKKAGLKPFYEIYGEEYETEYNKAVELGIGTKIKAHDLWIKIIESQIESGMPYMCFKDHANEKSNQKNFGVIHSSNLCSEIMEVTDSQTTAICTLTSIPVQKFVTDGKYDFNELGRVSRSITKSLNIAVDVNEYSTVEGRKGGLEQRALGIGIQGLADVYAILKLAFTSQESRKLNKEIFETIYFNALRQSCDLAKETGLTYDHYEGSPISKGIFQWEMWGLKEEDLSGMYDWKQLREDILLYGVRNSLVTTCPPTASSARVIGSNEAFEPFTSNLYVRKVTGGEFAMVNKHLVRDLEELGLWNREILNELIKYEGSLQKIPVIPQDIKDRYRTVWEISQKSLIEMSADRGPFIDQSQSLNIFFDTPTVAKLTTAHTLGWRLGLKTGQYYLRSQPVENKAKHLAIDMVKQNKPEKPIDSQFECFGCSS